MFISNPPSVCQTVPKHLCCKDLPAVDRLAAMVKSLGESPLFVEAYHEIMSRLSIRPSLTAEQQAAMLPLFMDELERRLPQILIVLGVSTLAPSLGEQTRKLLRSKGESRHTAEDLGQEFAVKILKALFGTWPRRNVGAWLSAIRRHVIVDHLRGGERDRKLFARAKDERRAVGV
ncbi:sigma factor [Zavarzinella formosa]|uniref:sigma factor n=1 Tax=Zavarzinella formosa TaxID=360055 RepID=UPI0002E8F32B|nr:sigma factor [Zavarzinella formosa]